MGSKTKVFEGIRKVPIKPYRVVSDFHAVGGTTTVDPVYSFLCLIGHSKALNIH